MGQVNADNLYDAAGTGSPSVVGINFSPTSSSPGSNATLAYTDNSIQFYTPSADIDLTLNTTHKAGRRLIIHNLASAYTITIKANDGTTVRTLYPLSHCELVATQNTPTTNTNWLGISFAYSPWFAVTPTGSWTTNVTLTGFMRRIGDDMEIDFNIVLGGAPTTASLTIDIPKSLGIDTAKLAAGADTKHKSLGIANVKDSGSDDYALYVGFGSTTTVALFTSRADATSSYITNPVNSTAPITFASGDEIYLRARFPIQGWTSTKG